MTQALIAGMYGKWIPRKSYDKQEIADENRKFTACVFFIQAIMLVICALFCTYLFRADWMQSYRTDDNALGVNLLSIPLVILLFIYTMAYTVKHPFLLCMHLLFGWMYMAYVLSSLLLNAGTEATLIFACPAAMSAAYSVIVWKKGIDLRSSIQFLIAGTVFLTAALIIWLRHGSAAEYATAGAGILLFLHIARQNITFLSVCNKIGNDGTAENFEEELGAALLLYFSALLLFVQLGRAGRLRGGSSGKSGSKGGGSFSGGGASGKW